MIGRKEVVFVAGALTATTRREVYRNIRKAAECAIEVAKKGYIVYCPHTHSNLIELLGNIGEPYWIEHCQCMLLLSDKVVLVPNNWRNSTGALGEIRLSESNHIPVYELEDLPDADS